MVEIDAGRAGPAARGLRGAACRDRRARGSRRRSSIALGLRRRGCRRASAAGLHAPTWRRTSISGRPVRNRPCQRDRRGRRARSDGQRSSSMAATPARRAPLPTGVLEAVLDALGTPRRHAGVDRVAGGRGGGRPQRACRAADRRGQRAGRPASQGCGSSAGGADVTAADAPSAAVRRAHLRHLPRLLVRCRRTLRWTWH